MTVTPMQVTWSIWLVIVTANFEVRQMKVVVVLLIVWRDWGNVRKIMGATEVPNNQSAADCMALSPWHADVKGLSHFTADRRLSTVLLLYSPVVTICTASLTSTTPRSAHKMYLCVFFLWIPEQTAIISLYSINWLVCIPETESVYCAVRTVQDLWHVWERIEMIQSPEWETWRKPFGRPRPDGKMILKGIL